MINQLSKLIITEEALSIALSKLNAFNLPGKIQANLFENVLEGAFNKVNSKVFLSPNEHSPYDLEIDGDKVSVKKGYQFDTCAIQNGEKSTYRSLIEFGALNQDGNVNLNVLNEQSFLNLINKTIIFFNEKPGYWHIYQIDHKKLFLLTKSIQYHKIKKLYQVDFYDNNGKSFMWLKCSDGIELEGQHNNAFQRGLWLNEKYDFPIFSELKISINKRKWPTLKEYLFS